VREEPDATHGDCTSMIDPRSAECGHDLAHEEI
jgi:hypothetical protein